ncbi:hypothetical protein L6452_35017 [Arctium lappa]|uniref:Uncharacterized protein n=1 Tax=Arctium lappa TaxID=4217 RepID=A0ACB8YKB7_ARCLA|nr:hypothetical protein L6452_35017 [Arctium lappa]
MGPLPSPKQGFSLTFHSTHLIHHSLFFTCHFAFLHNNLFKINPLLQIWVFKISVSRVFEDLKSLNTGVASKACGGVAYP